MALFLLHLNISASSVLAWRIPGTGEPGGLPSVGSHRVGHDWSDLAAAAAGWVEMPLLHSPWYKDVCMLNHHQTLCDLMDCSLPGSSVHGISQVRILEWVAMPSSRGSSRLRDQTHDSCIGRRILYHWATWKAPCVNIPLWLQTCNYKRHIKSLSPEISWKFSEMESVRQRTNFCRARQ